MLSKHSTVRLCYAGLDGQTCGVGPFRIALAEFAPLSDEAERDCCMVLHKFFEQTYGSGSSHAQTLAHALTKDQAIPLVINGFDEVPSHQVMLEEEKTLARVPITLGLLVHVL